MGIYTHFKLNDMPNYQKHRKEQKVAQRTTKEEKFVATTKSDIEILRDEFKEVSGDDADKRWSESTLKEKIDEHTS